MGTLGLPWLLLLAFGCYLLVWSCLGYSCFAYFGVGVSLLVLVTLECAWFALVCFVVSWLVTLGVSWRVLIGVGLS